MSMSDPIMYRDKLGQGIPALGPYHASTQTTNITDGTAQTLNIPTGTRYYELACLIPLYISTSGTATSSSAIFPAGAIVYKVLDGQTQVSVLRVSASDTGPVTLTPLG